MPRLTETLKADLDQASEYFNLRRVDPARVIEIRIYIATLEALHEIANTLQGILARLPAPAPIEEPMRAPGISTAAAPKRAKKAS